MSTRSRAPGRAAGSEAKAMRRGPAQAWYRQGIVWLGVLVFALSAAGSLWLMNVALRYDDPPLPLAEPALLKMPLARAATRPQAPSAPPPAQP